MGRTDLASFIRVTAEEGHAVDFDPRVEIDIESTGVSLNLDHGSFRSGSLDTKVCVAFVDSQVAEPKNVDALSQLNRVVHLV